MCDRFDNVKACCTQSQGKKRQEEADKDGMMISLVSQQHKVSYFTAENKNRCIYEEEVPLKVAIAVAGATFKHDYSPFHTKQLFCDCR